MMEGWKAEEKEPIGGSKVVTGMSGSSISEGSWERLAMGEGVRSLVKVVLLRGIRFRSLKLCMMLFLRVIVISQSFFCQGWCCGRLISGGADGRC